MSIFKAYDVRGIYPAELNDDIAYMIGKSFAEFLKPEKVVVGHDMRKSSPSLFSALTRGLLEQGVDVINIGLCTTPMFYFATGKLGVDGSIMITASHNPKEYNGLKFCRKDAVPIGGDSGIKDIEQFMQKNKFSASKKKGSMTSLSVKDDYIRHIARHYKPANQKLKLVVDCANSMGTMEMEVLSSLKNIKVVPLFEKMTGEFENHEANPLKAETLMHLQQEVVAQKADLGVAFDGDADRVGFVDEKGEIIPIDLSLAIIAETILKSGKQTILYDLRSSKVVKETIEKNGGKAVMCRVGHAFIKKQMRELGAFFAGELAGHFYFKDNYTTESSSLACIYMINTILEQKKTISKIVLPLKKYFHSGEINSKVLDVKKVLQRIEQEYEGKGKKVTLDGVSFYFPNWWFNVRGSNTEPLLRLNIEADTKVLMEEKKEELLSLIRS